MLIGGGVKKKGDDFLGHRPGEKTTCSDFTLNQIAKVLPSNLSISVEQLKVNDRRILWGFEENFQRLSPVIFYRREPVFWISRIDDCQYCERHTYQFDLEIRGVAALKPTANFICVITPRPTVYLFSLETHAADISNWLLGKEKWPCCVLIVNINSWKQWNAGAECYKDKIKRKKRPARRGTIKTMKIRARER